MKAKSTLNFQLSEFKCPCCGENKITGALVTKLQSLRDMINMPIHITSGYRCQLYNKKIGGYINSKHKKGEAGDIQALMSKVFLAKMAENVGFKRIGLYPNHVHLELGDKPLYWVVSRYGNKPIYYKTLEGAIKNYAM